MAARNSSSPRSVADATRFTSNRPHANTKSSPNIAISAAAAAQQQQQKQQQQKQQQALPRRGGPAAAAIPQQETMEERVRRLRAAHLAAKQHSVSRMDKVIGGSRRLFDAAHKFTVMGLIGFSSIALLVTVYATADMMMYNRKRRNEFFSLQKQLKEDSLEAARLAYMTGTASEEQIALVEAATAKAKEAGIALPSILSVPQSPAPAGGRETTTTTTAAMAAGEEEEEKKKGGGGGGGGGGVTGWLFGGLKKEDDAQTAAGDDSWRSTNTTSSSTSRENAADTSFRDKAKAAFENERDNQRRGGTLDQVGLVDAEGSSSGGKKKGWW
ncbi:hypothetical protein FHL15_009875 [Xylaria flabelliformis]|uniref:Uncharacterized protein n=1 Tax=Xylaria flabelliformis TaxID=2512241 RepID=A0A553HMM7_9PEZI|nr:hypothetical protein FHL15_009875 [Xylaria flabelliformis]